MRFIDMFLLHCLLSDSPPDSREEIAALARNQHSAAARGREPGLQLQRNGASVSLVDWGAELIEGCAPIAASARCRVRRHATIATRSRSRSRRGMRRHAAVGARAVGASRRGDGGCAYTAFVRERSVQAQAELLALPWSLEQQGLFDAEAQASLGSAARDRSRRHDAVRDLQAGLRFGQAA